MLSACPVLSSAGCPRKRDLTHPLTAGCFQTSSSPPTSVTNNPRSLNLADRRNEPLFPATPFTFIPPSEKTPLVSGGAALLRGSGGATCGRRPPPRPLPRSPRPAPPRGRATCALCGSPPRRSGRPPRREAGALLICLGRLQPRSPRAGLSGAAACGRGAPRLQRGEAAKSALRPQHHPQHPRLASPTGMAS